MDVMNAELDRLSRDYGNATPYYSSGNYVSGMGSSLPKDYSRDYSYDQNDRYNDDGYSDYAQPEREEEPMEWDTEYDDDFDGFDAGPGDLRYHYGGDPRGDQFLKANARLTVGYRRDEFNWNVASDITGTATPNIMSELTWKELKMTQMKLEADVVLNNQFVFEGMFSYADIYEGDVVDSDYAGDDRAGEFLRSDSKADDGQAMDWSLAMGYRVFLGDKLENTALGATDVWLTALVGYSYHDLDMIAVEGKWTIPDGGAIDSGLHSSYWAEWDGPWVGLELEGSKGRFFGNFRFEYHMAEFYGSANWNLRETFKHPVSFDQWADGFGLVFDFGAGYELTDDWVLNFDLGLQDWGGKDGRDRVFFADDTESIQMLNEVNWESRSYMIGSSYRF